MFQANKQEAIEENTRRTYIILTDMMNDRLQPMKETLEWMREIQTGVLGQSAGREPSRLPRWLTRKAGLRAGSGLFQENKQRAIEENTRRTHIILTDMMNDRLQPMKETLEWMREIQTGVLGQSAGREQCGISGETLGSGLFQENKQRAIEENTRRTYIILTDMMNDRLQPMKETLEWVREIQTGVLGQSAGREQCGISGETLGSGLFQENKQRAIEENTRRTYIILTDMMNDRLQPMKETLEWVREIQTGVLGKLGEDMDPKLATLVSEVSLQRTNQETVGAQTIGLLGAIVSAVENLDTNRSQELVLDETIIGQVVAGALNNFVTQAGGELVASELL